MQAKQRDAKYSTGLWLLLAVVLLLPSMWSPTSVTSGDEYSLYLRIPLESLTSGHWLPPYHLGEPRLQKPHLINWLVAANFKVFGISFAAARSVALVFALLLLVAVLRLDQLDNGQQRGLPALVLLSFVFYQDLARVIILDVPTACCIAWAWYAWRRWLSSQCWRYFAMLQWWLWLAFMIKWVVGLWFFGAAIIAYRLTYGRRHVPTQKLLLLFSVQAVVCAIYPALLYYWYPDHVSSAAEIMVSDRQPGLQQFWQLQAVTAWFIAMLPWGLVLVAGLVDEFAKKWPQPSHQFYWLWIAISIVPFLFIKVFSRYYLPLLVPATFLLCDYLSANRYVVWRIISYAALAVLLAFFCGMAIWFAHAILAPLICMLSIVLALIFAKRYSQDTRYELTAVVIAISCYWGVVYPSLGIQQVPLKVIEAARQQPYVYFETTRDLPAMPALLPIMMQHLPEKSLQANYTGLVFVAEPNVADFTKRLQELHLCSTSHEQFTMLAKHVTFLRFYRPDITREDIFAALQTRSLLPVSHHVHYYHVQPCGRDSKS